MKISDDNDKFLNAQFSIPTGKIISIDAGEVVGVQYDGTILFGRVIDLEKIGYVDVLKIDASAQYQSCTRAIPINNITDVFHTGKGIS